MDESWRMSMSMGMSMPSRGSEDMSSWATANPGNIGASGMDLEDFHDVFGGPPRSVLNRNSSCDIAGYDYFYHDIFQRPDEEKADRRTGMRLPVFTIPSSKPAEEKGRFRDGEEGGARKEKKPPSRMWRSLSRSNCTSKSKTGSIPIQKGIKSENVALNSFSSKLRPINVPCRWNSTSGIESNQTCYNPIDDHHYPTNEHLTRYSNPGFSQQFPSPEAEVPYSTTIGIPVDDDDEELESPSSANTMLCHGSVASKAEINHFNASYDEEEDDIFSSYVIEINSGRREATNEAVDIDEAIAWAKGTFQGCSSSTGDLNSRQHDNSYRFGGERSMIPLGMEVPRNVSQRYSIIPLYMKEEIDDGMGMVELNERVNCWSGGKETDIRLLLSTLHHILWESSGWKAVTYSQLIEHSQLKKAYQRARLCIHPDKLQQRGASDVQKYTAKRAFSALQNAWDAFISQEIFE